MLNALHHHELISETQQSEIELSRIIRTKKVDHVQPKKIKNYDLYSNIASSNRDSNQEEYHKQVVIVEPLSNKDSSIAVDKFFSNDLFLA